MKVLELKEISKIYDEGKPTEVRAVDGVDLAVSADCS